MLLRSKAVRAGLVAVLGVLTPCLSLGSIKGDRDGDGDVDLVDFGGFAECMAGPDGGLALNCGALDFDNDADVDAFDFAGFQIVFGIGGPIEIETVEVGNPGNAGELSGEGAGGHGPDRLCGGVDYTYSIGKYEVTAGQYTAFLNAVASTDPHGLYSGNMWSAVDGCKIEQHGDSGSYTYTVSQEWADRPVNYVNWGDAARFVNWLHNGQPVGAQDLPTTEDGAYYLNGETDEGLFSVARESDATWVIPSEDEWYKAAYHFNDGVTSNYWDYPTGTNTLPTSEAPPGTDLTNGSANYNTWSNGAPYFRTVGGAYDAKPSVSPYGTFDQGGNVWEWTDTSMFDWAKCLRGSSYGNDFEMMHAAHRQEAPPALTFGHVGFRIARVR